MLGKLCTGTFSDDTRQTLTGNRNRAQWQMYPCEECRLLVGARQDQGQWLPEAHWQSVTYTTRRKMANASPPRSAVSGMHTY